MGAFGATIPVTTLNNGFLGAVSRIGKRTIAARQILSTSAIGAFFGDPMVIVADATGGTYQSVKDYITGGGTFTAAKFAGVALREVKTQIAFNSLFNIGSNASIGQYVPGEIAEVLEEGSITVKINVGTPASQGTVYVRTVLNGAIPAGLVGGFEAAADGSNTVALTGVVFRTGVLDANGVAEITILNRVAA